MIYLRLLFIILLLTSVISPRSSLITYAHASSSDYIVPVAVAGSDSQGNSVWESVFGTKDRQPPDIQIEDLSDSQTVYTDSIYIAGRIADASEIGTVTLNNTLISTTEGRNILFSRLVELRDGDNIITVEAEDSEGNRAKKEITVIKKNMQLSELPAEIFDKRMRLAIYPFDQKGTYSEKSSYFQDIFTLAFQQQNRFQLIDRTIMDRILEEQELSRSGLVDRNAAIKLGKLMSAQAIITGSISETERGIEIVGRMIDTETSKILVTEKIYCTTRDISALKFLAESMVVNLVNDLPMLQGIVIKRKDGHIYIDLGQDRMALHGRLIIYRDSGPDSLNSKESAVLGLARVTQVFRDMSKAELIEGRFDDIKELDRVIIQ